MYVYPLQWVLNAAAGAGFDGIELALGPEAILRGPAVMRALAEGASLRVLSVHPPLLPLPGWRSFADTPKLMDFAAEAGASVVVQHTPDAEHLANADGVVWRRSVDEARRRGMKRGVTLALENRAIFSERQREFALADPESLYRFAEEYDFPLTLDTAHAASWPWDILEVYELFRDRLVNIHLSDFRLLPAWLDQPMLHTYIKHHQLLGSGILPLRELITRVHADGYAGLITLELSPIALRAWRPAQVRSNLVSTVDFVRDGFGQLSPQEHLTDLTLGS